MYWGGDDLSAIPQLFLVQVAISSGESFFPSRARINAEVAEEVGNSRLIESSLATLHFYQVGVSERSLRRWSKTLEEEEMMVASQRGHHAKTISPIVDPDFREKFCSHVRSESCRKGNFCKCDENRSSTKEKKNLPKSVLQLCLNFFLFRTAPSHNCNACKVGQF